MLKSPSNFFSKHLKIELIRSLFISFIFSILAISGSTFMDILPVDLIQANNVIVLFFTFFFTLLLLHLSLLSTNKSILERVIITIIGLSIITSFVLIYIKKYIHYDIEDQKKPALYIFYNHKSKSIVDKENIKSSISKINTHLSIKEEEFLIKPIKLNFTGGIRGSLLEKHLKAKKNIIGYINLGNTEPFHLTSNLFLLDSFSSYGISEISVEKNFSDNSLDTFKMSFKKDFFWINTEFFFKKSNYSFAKQSFINFGISFSESQSTTSPIKNTINTVNNGVKSPGKLLEPSLYLAINDTLSNYLFINGNPSSHCHLLPSLMENFPTHIIKETIFTQNDPKLYKLLNCLSNYSDVRTKEIIKEIFTNQKNKHLLKTYLKKVLLLNLTESVRDTVFFDDLKKIEEGYKSCNTGRPFNDFTCIIIKADKIIGLMTEKKVMAEVFLDSIHSRLKTSILSTIESDALDSNHIKVMIAEAQRYYNDIGASSYSCDWDWSPYFLAYLTKYSIDESLKKTQNIFRYSGCSPSKLDIADLAIVNFDIPKFEKKMNAWGTNILPTTTVSEAIKLVSNDLLSSFKIQDERLKNYILKQSYFFESYASNINNWYIEGVIKSNELSWIDKASHLIELYKSPYNASSTIQHWIDFEPKTFSKSSNAMHDIFKLITPNEFKKIHFIKQIADGKILKNEDLRGVNFNKDLYKALVYAEKHIDLNSESLSKIIYKNINEIENLDPKAKESLTHKHYKLTHSILSQNYTSAKKHIKEITSQGNYNLGFYQYLLELIEKSKSPEKCQVKNYDLAMLLHAYFIRFDLFDSELDNYILKDIKTAKDFESLIGKHWQKKFEFLVGEHWQKELGTHKNGNNSEERKYQLRYNSLLAPCQNTIDIP